MLQNPPPINHKRIQKLSKLKNTNKDHRDYKTYLLKPIISHQKRENKSSKSTTSNILLLVMTNQKLWNSWTKHDNKTNPVRLLSQKWWGYWIHSPRFCLFCCKKNLKSLQPISRLLKQELKVQWIRKRSSGYYFIEKDWKAETLCNSFGWYREGSLVGFKRLALCWKL